MWTLWVKYLNLFRLYEYCKTRIAALRHQRHTVTRMPYCRKIYTCDLDFLCNGCLSSSGTWEVLKEESSASVYWLSSIFLILRLSVKCLIWSRAESPILYSSSLYLKWTNRRAQRIFFSLSVLCNQITFHLNLYSCRMSYYICRKKVACINYWVL